MAENLEKLLASLQMDNSTGGALRIVGGTGALFYGIKEGDRQLWEEMIKYGDDVSIQNAIKDGKSYLLTQVIGNPEDEGNKILRENEAHYGNIMLHNRMVNAHDQSIVKLKNLKNNDERIRLLQGNYKGADYLLRYYELKQKNALTQPEKAAEKRADISKAISFQDVEGKTPLLLACKNVNQQYALRLIKLDEKGCTLNVSDKIENRTPLHIACILGLKEVVFKLLNCGVNKEVVDKYGCEPFYYVTCSDEEKRQNIQSVLDSVYFFWGRYFNDGDRECVVTELLDRNNVLRKGLAEEKILLEENAEKYKKEGTKPFTKFVEKL